MYVRSNSSAPLYEVEPLLNESDSMPVQMIARFYAKAVLVSHNEPHSESDMQPEW